MNKEYNLAVAFINFKGAYSKLVEASMAMPDLDVSENYPFYLLDFEEIENAVKQWCVVHATRLMKYLPERVDNPRCLGCKHLRAGLNPQGLCVGLAEEGCSVHPEIPYSKAAVIPYLTNNGVDTSQLGDDEIHLLYINKTEVAYERRRKHNNL